MAGLIASLVIGGTVLVVVLMWCAAGTVLVDSAVKEVKSGGKDAWWIFVFIGFVIACLLIGLMGHN